MKLKTIIFECPPLAAINVYKEALGVVDGTVSPYAPNYDLEFGLESSTYPIFLADGRVQLKINPKKYTRVTEFVGGNAPSLKDYWSGIYKEVRLARIGFEINVVDIRAPLKLLFQRIMEYQASNVFQQGTWRTLTCWDSVRIEPDAFENGSLVTQRVGVILDVTASDGDGNYGPTPRHLCGSDSPVPELLYSQGFTIKFLEADPREIL